MFCSRQALSAILGLVSIFHHPESDLSIERLRETWSAREAAAHIDAVMCFKADGLVLGAGTALAPASKNGAAPSVDFEGCEARLLALLSVVYDRPVSPQVMKHIRSAALRWRDGDEGAASVHLALTGLGQLGRLGEAAWRLFAADEMLRRGLEPVDLLKAANLDAAALESMAKYNPDQPRVPAGSGRTSGEWAGGNASAVQPGERDPPPAVTETSSPLATRQSAGTTAANIDTSLLEPVVDRTEYHNIVRDWLAGVLRSTGSTVETEVPLSLVGSGLTSNVDLLVKPLGSGVPYLLEVKTGRDPPFTVNQAIIFPVALFGNHLYSTSPKILWFGFAQGETLPPMAVWTVRIDKPEGEIKAYQLDKNGEWHLHKGVEGEALASRSPDPLSLP